MRQGKVLFKGLLAGILTETNDGEYVFQYDARETLSYTIKVSIKKY